MVSTPSTWSHGTLAQNQWLSKRKRLPISKIIDYHHTATDLPSRRQKYLFGSCQEEVEIVPKNSKCEHDLDISEVTYDATKNITKEPKSNEDPDFEK